MPSNPKKIDSPTTQKNMRPKVQGELYAGPVPHPDILEKLNNILPGAAERIFLMAEKDQDQTIAMQNGTLNLNFQHVHNDYKIRTRAQWLAFLVCLLFLGCGTWLVLEGHDEVGGVMLGGTLASIIASFLYANSRNKKSSS